MTLQVRRHYWDIFCNGYQKLLGRALLYLNTVSGIMSRDLKWKCTSHYKWIAAMLKSLTAHFSWAVNRNNHRHWLDLSSNDFYLTKFLLLVSKIPTIWVKCHWQPEVICIYCISQWQECQQPWFLPWTYWATVAILLIPLKALVQQPTSSRWVSSFSYNFIFHCLNNLIWGPGKPIPRIDTSILWN